jgi:hypothetical protein
MNPRQAIAFEHPCARGHETMSDQYWDWMWFKGRTLSTILTLNK